MESQNHRMAWTRRHFKATQFQSPVVGKGTSQQLGLSKTSSNPALRISRGGRFIASLGSLCQHFTALSMKNFT